MFCLLSPFDMAWGGVVYTFCVNVIPFRFVCPHLPLPLALAVAIYVTSIENTINFCVFNCTQFCN